jgi:hypothetical protein
VDLPGGAAPRRAPTGWIPWVTLIVGTSLAANVAVGGADPIGKALASRLVSLASIADVDYGYCKQSGACGSERDCSPVRRPR